jgi:hypothetical protein
LGAHANWYGSCVLPEGCGEMENAAMTVRIKG